MSKNESCIFCQIIEKKIPAAIEHENNNFIAIADINPQAPIHILIIPKKHSSNITEVSEPTELGELIAGAKILASKKGVNKDFRLVINTGKQAGQTVDHLHIHLLGGRDLHWPPG